MAQATTTVDEAALAKLGFARLLWRKPVTWDGVEIPAGTPVDLALPGLTPTKLVSLLRSRFVEYGLPTLAAAGVS